MPDSVTGSWTPRQIGNLPTKFQQAGTVIGQQIITYGGCSIPPNSSFSCEGQDSYVINVPTGLNIPPAPCPAPRQNAVLVPNFNDFSTAFVSQVFLLLGTFNTSLWQDDGGLLHGEVAVLDINTGSWSRVLPSGDPGTRNGSSFPSPRQGAAAFASSIGLVGSSRPSFSDTIVFGGRDASGTYLSEVSVVETDFEPHFLTLKVAGLVVTCI